MVALGLGIGGCGLNVMFTLLGMGTAGNGSEVGKSYLAGCNYKIEEGPKNCFIYSMSSFLTIML